MIHSSTLQQLFPTADILSEHQPPSPVHQRHYLIDGELRPWEGPLETVRSPVCVRGEGTLEQVELGSYPVGGEQEAEEALAAAVAAYDEGRGVWPTMTVAGRIACMEDFTARMIASRQEVIKLIMWEIGKSQTDSREGVRSNCRLHPGHDRGTQRARQQQLAVPDRRRHDRADPAHSAWCRAVHGPVQLSAQ